ncbi:YciI family protein [Winogradskyella wichelsiae]|uniref:YciI family protein n=1 Tax=Winogradskyella wichelsiae TaxID=2697007 RepID=UPI0015CE4250|nr:hypothetical protein [Winogradskyella wichelsiae]
MVRVKHILLVAIIFYSFLSCKNETSTETKAQVPSVFNADESGKEVADVLKEKELSVSALKKKLVREGYEVFDYVDPKTKDTILMQQYFMAFLKEGPIRNQNEEEAVLLQEEHLAHLSKMYDLGYADISGPLDGDSAIKGVTIYNVPTLKIADSLAHTDPMVKEGRLIIELHPWWAAKGFRLR